MYHIFFIHSSVDEHLGCFHVLAIVNSAAMNISVQIFVWIHALVSLGYMHLGNVSISVWLELRVEFLAHMITL